MKSEDTKAMQILERLLALPDGDLRNTLGVAQEYADHDSVLNKPQLPAGTRLMRMLELALSEMEGGDEE